MSNALEQAVVARRVPAWPGRWFIFIRLYSDIAFEYPSLLRLWLKRRSAFWQYILRLEERRLVRKAVKRGEACALER